MLPQPQPQNPPIESERDLQLTLSAVLDEARKLSEGLDPLVGKYELKSSEFLFGLIVALGFFLASIALRPRITSLLGLAALPIIVASSILLGIALGIFLFRGPSRWRFERNLSRLALQLQVLRDEITRLEKIDDKPTEVTTKLWLAYEETIDAYRQVERFSYRASNFPFVLLSDRQK